MTNTIPEAQPSRTPWLTADEAAARAQVSTKTIYRMVASGRLKVARVGRAIRTRADWVDDALLSLVPNEGGR